MINLRSLWALKGRSQMGSRMGSMYKYYFYNSKRSLYCTSSLGIDSFIIWKRKTLASIRNLDQLRGNLKNICESNEKSVPFLSNLKKMIAIADSDEDLELLYTLLRKYCKNKEVVVFQCFQFGPQIMRLLHLKNKHHDAVKLVEDEDLFPYFQHLMTAVLLLDLLFKNNKYEEVIRIYEKYQNEVQFKFPPTTCHALYFAACYKLNTAECFEKAVQVQKLCFDRKTRIPLRNNLFFAALAIKQNQPVCAIATLDRPTFNCMAENLKCMAYAQAKRFDDIYCSIRLILSSPKAEKFFFTEEAVSFIENEINKEDNNEQHELEFRKLKQELLSKNIILNQPLDNYLFGKLYYPISHRGPRPDL